jgi:hypothetical protein
VSRFYSHATRIAKVEDLGPALSARLMALLGDSERMAPRQRGPDAR